MSAPAPPPLPPQRTSRGHDPDGAGGVQRAVLVVAAVVAMVSLSSCLVLPFVPRDDSGSATGSPTTETTATPQTLPASQPGLESFYSQSLRWSSCSGGQCAQLTVPVDYANPSGATIELALLKVPASSASDRVGSLVVNPGGPGGSGVDYARHANQIVSTEVRRKLRHRRLRPARGRGLGPAGLSDRPGPRPVPRHGPDARQPH